MPHDSEHLPPPENGPGIRPRPSPGEVAVWLLTATAREVEAGDRLSGVLSDVEQQRRDSLARAADRRLYVLAHVGLRVVLGDYLGLAPEQVELRRAPCPLCGEPHGRPEVAAAPPLHFSLSHSGTAALYAVAAAPVGADIESAGNLSATDWETLPVLHPAERAAVGRLPPADRRTALLHCWVHKEAYLKGLGTGLGVDPMSVLVGLGSAFASPSHPRPPGWGLASVPSPRGYAGAVALQGATDPVVVPHRLSLADHATVPPPPRDRCSRPELRPELRSELRSELPLG
ncbi:4'-phosphopantetheinyl transferase family protein [Actinacidiphila rubida]|uniref:4'-phosphopantetheinyl transferase n=1 Tax=Actinacidiphila rubida TaxID=310780 RepID=A0A1H8KBH8_9ACTN|nr:4'-phosphopantetheinyl transferase superfamily protein [Actinacidiphila rubida]SEN90097.1 4'-phosphopantetheinyl transferase [Actinacidiphila rubida]